MKTKEIVVVSGPHKHKFKVKDDLKKITVWNLGDKDHPLTKADFEKFRVLLVKAYADPEFSIIVPYHVKVRRIPK